MKKIRPKDNDVKRHFRRRFQERYSIRITDDDYNNMIRQIKDATCFTFVASQSLSRKIHRVTLNDKKYLVVYNPVKKILHTVLPDGAKAMGSLEKIRNDNTVAISGVSYDGNES